jgi:RNA polymerase sigma factor (sigma-70 family)
MANTPNKNGETYKTRQTLLEKVKDKHNDESWEEFVYYYEGYIYILCRRMNLNHHDAEEIVQKVLLNLWGALPEFQYDNNRKFRTWLNTVTRNEVRNYLRNTSRQNKKVIKATEDVHSDIANSEAIPDIEKIAEEEWHVYIASMAFANIKDDFSEKTIEVFLKLSKGESNISVAEEMGIPRNTIAVYKKRITAKLSKEIRRLNHELG